MGGNGPLPFVVPWHLRGSLITWDSGAGRGEPRESPSRWLLNNKKVKGKNNTLLRQRVCSGGAGSVRVPLSMPPPLRCNKPPFGDPMGLNGKDLLHTYCKNTESGGCLVSENCTIKTRYFMPIHEIGPRFASKTGDSAWFRVAPAWICII